MKNARIHLLLLLTCIFAAFTFGLFAGRNLNRTPVQISALPAITAAATAPLDDATMEAAEPENAAPAAVNINTATSEQLQLLSGIGPVLAERIIAYREEHGAFTSIGELMNVSGIGEKKLEAIWDLITIGG